jgi:hypothetical protein
VPGRAGERPLGPPRRAAMSGRSIPRACRGPQASGLDDRAGHWRRADEVAAVLSQVILGLQLPFLVQITRPRPLTCQVASGVDSFYLPSTGYQCARRRSQAMRRNHRRRTGIAAAPCRSWQSRAATKPPTSARGVFLNVGAANSHFARRQWGGCWRHLQRKGRGQVSADTAPQRTEWPSCRGDCSVRRTCRGLCRIRPMRG